MAEVLVLGPDSEREFILFELQQLLDHCLEDTMKILIPVLCKHVPNWNIDLQIKAAQRLFDVVCLKLEPAVANMITCASFGVIHRSKGCAAPEYEELYNLWGVLLVDCLPNMEWSPQEIKDVLNLVDIHSKESYTSRKVAARVIGALAQCLHKSKVEKIILPRALQLFGDTDVEVRGTVVESLANIGAALPIRVTESMVWPRIEGLLKPPEEARIRATAMRTMAHILEAHRSSPGQHRLYRELLPPVFNSLAAFARKFSAEDQRHVPDDTYLILEVVSEVFGQFAYSLSLCPTTKKTFRKEAYKAYAGMATCNAPLIRRHCAFNLPGVAKALGDRYALELSGVCNYLANDMDEQVRWIVAAGIHETAQLLAPRGNFERLFGAVCALLQDESPMVRMNALTHFHELLTAFAKDGSDPASLRRLAPVFTDLTMLSEGEWRIQRSLAEQLGQCADIIPPDALLDNVLPLLYRLTKQGTPLVREAAMNATAKSIRKIPIRDRKLALDKYWRAAAHGPFWMRLALLDGGAAAMSVFSHKGFVELFAEDMLLLANDPVPNVRIRVATLMAKMAPMCKGMPSFDKALETLRKDNDEDVIQIMKKYDEAELAAMKEARERQSEDNSKYKEEQEFYGQSKPQKRARGRVPQVKGNHRMGIPGRRPSMEQVSENLSASKDIVAAGMTTSRLASEMKPGYAIPRDVDVEDMPYGANLPDDMIHGGEGMGMMSGLADGDVEVAAEGIMDGHNGPAMVVDSGIGAPMHVHPQSGMTSEQLLHEPDMRSGVNMHSMQPDNGASHGHSSHEDRPIYNNAANAGSDTRPNELMNGTVPVLQKSGSGNAGRYEARSKSWNGIIVQLPRQLSMESRQRRNAAKNGNNLNADGGGGNGKQHPQQPHQHSGWSLSKRKPSKLRGKKKRGGTGNNPSSHVADESNMSEASVSTDMADVSVEVVEYSTASANAPRQNITARAKSMVHPSLGNAPNVSSSIDAEGLPNVGMTADGAVIGGGLEGGGRKGGMLSGKGRKKGEQLVAVTYEKESGLPSFKGHAPWTRPKQDNEDIDALSEVVQRMEFGPPTDNLANGMDMHMQMQMQMEMGGKYDQHHEQDGMYMMGNSGMNKSTRGMGPRNSGGGGVGGGGSTMSELSMVAGGGPESGSNTTSNHLSMDGGSIAGNQPHLHIHPTQTQQHQQHHHPGVGGGNGGNGGNGGFLRGLFRRRR